MFSLCTTTESLQISKCMYWENLGQSQVNQKSCHKVCFLVLHDFQDHLDFRTSHTLLPKFTYIMYKLKSMKYSVCICKLVILAGSFRELYSINCKLFITCGTYRCCLEVELSRASAGPGTGDSRTSEGPSSLLLPRSPLPSTMVHILPRLRLLPPTRRSIQRLNRRLHPHAQKKINLHVPIHTRSTSSTRIIVLY